MTILNRENRLLLQRILDQINDLEKYEKEKESMRKNRTLWYAAERIFEKIGELINRGRGAMSELTQPIFRNFKEFRNNLAHKIDTDVEIVIKSFDSLKDLKTEINAIVESSYSEDKDLCSFELFGGFGTTKERQKYVDAIVDKLSNSSSEDLIKFPQNKGIKNLSDATEAILSHRDLLVLSSQNPEIAKEISQDIAKWAKKVSIEIKKNNPFEEEENFFHFVENLERKEFVKKLSAIKKELSKIYEHEINFPFYIKKNRELIDTLKEEDLHEHQVHEIEKQQDILKQAFLNDWEKLLTERRLKYELAVIDNARKQLIADLYKRIEDYLKLKELLTPFTNDFGRLWDMTGGIWNKTGFEILKKYAELLQKDESIKKLAELLGRYRKAEKEEEEIMFHETIIKNEWKIKHAQKNEFVGIRESDDLNTMLPMEASLLADEDTEIIFFKKYADKKLLTFDYRNLISVSEKEESTTLTEKEENKGPIILCVDTSGSMKGTPENIAKLLCFAILKIAMKDKRKCYLISFSDSINTLDLSDIPKSLENLIDFLTMSFNGGTDATLALEEALNMLEEEDFKKADVLFVSDFVMQEFKDELKVKIENAQQNRTSFHSLTIGSTGNNNVINIFDNQWVYNPNNVGDLIKKMKTI